MVSESGDSLGILKMLAFEKSVDSIAISTNKLVAGLSSLEGNIWDGCVKVLAVESGQQLASAALPCGTNTVKCTTDGSVLVGRDDGVISLMSEDLESLGDFDDHDDIVSAIAHIENSSKFFSSGWDGTILQWDWESRTASKPVIAYRTAHYGHVNDISQCGTDCLISGGDDGFIRLWDSRAAPDIGCSRLISVGQAISCLHVTPSAPYRIFAGSDCGSLFSFDIRQDVCENTLLSQASSKFHRKRIRRLASTANFSNILFSASDDATIGVSDITFNEIGEIAVDVSHKNRLTPHQDYISDICVVENDDSTFTVFSGSTDKKICMTVYNHSM